MPHLFERDRAAKHPPDHLSFAYHSPRCIFLLCRRHSNTRVFGGTSRNAGCADDRARTDSRSSLIFAPDPDSAAAANEDVAAEINSRTDMYTVLDRIHDRRWRTY